jgi:RND family efflux transporter MFP subunit
MKLIPALLFLVLTFTGCGRRSQADLEAASKSRAAEPTAVRVATAETRRFSRAVSVTGSLQADETVSVSSEVAGRLDSVRCDFGQFVRKGDILAELDKREFQLQHDRARAALAQALARIGLDPSQEQVTPELTPDIRQTRAQMEDARFKYDSAARLVKSGDVSQERFIEVEKALHAREAAYQAARDGLRMQLASVQGLRAEVKLAQKRLDDATVRAPFDGSISARLVSPGQYLRENTPIATLVKADPLRLRADIPESAASGARIGATLAFTTDAAPGATFQARITRLNPTLDARSRSLTAEARLTGHDPRLRPGIFVQVQLALERDSESVVVPREALYQLAGLTKIFLVRDGRASELKIAPGREIDGWMEVPAGRIHPGDQVAVSRLAQLIDGAPVRIEARR